MTAPTSDYASTLQAAARASAQGDVDQAVALLTLAAEDAADNGAGLLLLGAQLASVGAVDRAEAAYSNALLRAPGLLVARFQLGLLQLTSGRAALAFLTWQPLAQLPPSEPFRFYVLGYMALAQDQFDLCIRYFEEGLEVQQDNVALMQDIRKTMAVVKEKCLVPLNGTTSSSEGAVPAAHVLLSNYSATSQ